CSSTSAAASSSTCTRSVIRSDSPTRPYPPDGVAADHPKQPECPQPAAEASLVMVDTSEVVVVGGGIGGASLAFALAHAGIGVTVLEASAEFADRVRGESMQPWGVSEARALGVEQVLLDAGAHLTPLWKQYTEGTGEIAEIPMALMIPGI